MKFPQSLLLGGVALLVGLFTSCGRDDRPVLHVYNWSDYMADGLIEQFEEAFNCRVVYDTFDSNEALFAKLQAGAAGYDVIFPSSYYVSLMAPLGMLQPINHANIPNLAQVDPTFLETVSLDKEMAYSVPYMTGTTGIAYRRDRVEDFEPSWEIYSRTDLAGRLTLLDDHREVLGAALKTLGHSLNSLDPAAIEAAADRVIAWKRNIARFDNEGYKAGIASREFWVVHGFGGDVQQVIDDNEDAQIVYVLPREGFSVWEDTMAIPTGARNVELAEHFINFMHSPEVAAANIAANYYRCPNTGAYALIDEKIRHNPVVFIPEAQLANGEQILDVGEHIQLYNRAWDRVKAAR